MIPRFQGCTLDAEEKDAIEKIETYGWMVMNIKDEPGKSGWSYTIGMYETYGHPEIIIFGMSVDSRHSILNWIGKNIKEGKPFAAEQEHDWVLTEYGCWSKPVQKRWYYSLLGWARWFYQTKDQQDNFPCVQALWPDKHGKYPWDSEYAYSDQPLLYEENLVSARMMHYAAETELSKEEWPFDHDPHTQTYVSRCVVEDGAPIVRVTRDYDGDWQFIGPVEDPGEDGCKILCLHCVVERDPSVKLLAGLTPGMRALRETSSDKWELEAFNAKESDS
jgi:hypothetical protein